MQIESFLIGWLNAQNIEAEAYAAPERWEGPKPSRFMTLERVGGPSNGYLDNPMVAVQFWARSKADAEELATEVDRIILRDLPNEDAITHVSRNSLVYYPTEFGEPRYQAVYDISVFEH